jgi:hypothetical protein
VVNIIVKMTMEHCLVSCFLIRHITICRIQRYILLSGTQGVVKKNYADVLVGWGRKLWRALKRHALDARALLQAVSFVP